MPAHRIVTAGDAATRHFRRRSYFDSTEIPFRYGHKLFGNRNLGDMFKSNLQIANQFGEGLGSHFFENWYARVDLGPAPSLAVRAAFERWALYSRVWVIVGDMPTGWESSVAELLRGRPWCPPERLDQEVSGDEMAAFERRRREGLYPIVVPVRQHYAVQINSESETFDALDTLMAANGIPQEGRLWIHLEGISAFVEGIRQP